MNTIVAVSFDCIHKIAGVTSCGCGCFSFFKCCVVPVQRKSGQYCVGSVEAKQVLPYP